ncbi:uncharacterized protein L201_005763 [Kwoniella dendrophila CBS 6074]|uniref:Zn(2)-C6 fungal-type domain-containing protein n=1 Tax=Kwoniella dendrophila CBS 6074 TaxID=1295534 RepID=A0AAX4JZF7_9TREE
MQESLFPTFPPHPFQSRGSPSLFHTENQYNQAQYRSTLPSFHNLGGNRQSSSQAEIKAIHLPREDSNCRNEYPESNGRSVIPSTTYNNNHLHHPQLIPSSNLHNHIHNGDFGRFSPRTYPTPFSPLLSSNIQSSIQATLPDDDSVRHQGQGRRRRGRLSTACVNCHRRKQRCDGNGSQACGLCVKRGVSCSFRTESDTSYNAYANRYSTSTNYNASRVNPMSTAPLGASLTDSASASNSVSYTLPPIQPSFEHDQEHTSLFEPERERDISRLPPFVEYGHKRYYNYGDYAREPIGESSMNGQVFFSASPTPAYMHNEPGTMIEYKYKYNKVNQHPDSYSDAGEISRNSSSSSSSQAQTNDSYPESSVRSTIPSDTALDRGSYIDDYWKPYAITREAKANLINNSVMASNRRNISISHLIESQEEEEYFHY